MKSIELLQTTSAAVNITTNPQDLGDLVRFSISVIFTGSNVVGSLKLQASLDQVNYFDIPDSVQAVTASAGHIWDVVASGYRYVRAVWTYTSGTGNITMGMFIKSNVVSFA